MSFFGVDFVEVESDKEELIAKECPFCGKRDHFYLNKSKNAYKCHSGSCQEGGGYQQWLTHVYCLTIDNVPPAVIKTVAKERRLPTEAFELMEGRFGYLNDLYWFPVYNEKRKLVSLRYISLGQKPKNIAGSHSGIYNLFSGDCKVPIYICEGEFDCIALTWLLKITDTPGWAISIPGSHTFKKNWADLFYNKEVILCLDNDSAGEEGSKRIKAFLHSRVKTLKKINWPVEFPQRYDINDFVSAYCLSSPVNGLALLNKHIHNYSNKAHFDSEELAKIPGHLTFEDLLEEYEKVLDINEDFKQAIKISLATALSLQVPGSNPIWMFLVGPPGYGKTALLSSMQHADCCEFLSSIKRETLISGFKMPDGSDPSVLAKMDQRLMILKDYTEVLQLNAHERKEVVSVLRGIYDERVDRLFGNTVYRSYKVTMGILAGVTDEIKHHSEAAFGDRFLRYSIDTSKIDYKKQQKKAALSALFGITETEDLKLYVKRFLEQKRNINMGVVAKMLAKSGDFNDAIQPLAKLTAILQTEVRRHEFGYNSQEVSYEPREISGNRLACQFLRFAISLALVEEASTLQESHYQTIKRIAFDTVDSYESRICCLLAQQNGKKPYLSRQEIMDQIGIRKTSTNNYLDNLAMKRTIKSIQQENPKNGSMMYYYGVTQRLRDLWKEIK